MWLNITKPSADRNLTAAVICQRFSLPANMKQWRHRPAVSDNLEFLSAFLREGVERSLPSVRRGVEGWRLRSSESAGGVGGRRPPVSRHGDERCPRRTVTNCAGPLVARSPAPWCRRRTADLSIDETAAASDYPAEERVLAVLWLVDRSSVGSSAFPPAAMGGTCIIINPMRNSMNHHWRAAS